jgi:hypothetical protein
VPQLRITSPRRTAGLIVASAALLFLAACGGGSDTPATGDDNQDGGAGGRNVFTAYTACLAENGVTITMPSGGSRARPSGFPSGRPRPSGSARAGSEVPGGGFPGGGFGQPAGVDDATWQKAQQACASVRPSGRPGGGRGTGMIPAYRNCLQENGVTPGQGGLATDDPATKKAIEVCQVLAPSAAPSP